MPNTKYAFKHGHILFKNLPKWRDFAKSGHTIRRRRCRRRHCCCRRRCRRRRRRYLRHESLSACVKEEEEKSFRFCRCRGQLWRPTHTFAFKLACQIQEALAL